MTGRRATRALAASLLAAALGLAWLAAGTSSAEANDVIRISANKTTSIKIAKGKPKTTKTSVPFYEIVLGDPEVANVNPLTDDSFYVLGNALGTTGIALFDENKQLVGTVDIEVTLTDGTQTALPALPIMVGGRRPRAGSTLPGPGADTRAVLAGLGYAPERIDALLAGGAAS